MQINEPRFPKEYLIGPTLRRFHLKSEYYFIKASYHNEERIYAINHATKDLIQRVKIDKQNLKQSIGAFFEEWPSFPDQTLTATVYTDMESNISISEQEPRQQFIEKLVAKKHEEVVKFIELSRAQDTTLGEDTIEFMKDFLIPFYSCTKELQGLRPSDAFLTCFFDTIFLLFPLGKKIFSTVRKASDRMINLSFLINGNQAFKVDGKFLWKKISSDLYVYNTIVNEHCLLRSAMVDMLLNSIDPGIGLIKELKNTLKNTAMIIMKGGLIRLSILSIKELKHFAEFAIRTKSVSESTKNLVVKVSKSSGRINTQHTGEDDDTQFSSFKHGNAYQHGDYYAYMSSRGKVDMLLGISDEMAENEENIYVLLEGEELNGVIFRCICLRKPFSSCEITPWFSPEVGRDKILYPVIENATNDDAIVFNANATTRYKQIIFYPEYQCILYQDGVKGSKPFNLFKIDHAYYVLDHEAKHFRLLYDGDVVDVVNVKNKNKDAPIYYAHKNSNGDLVVGRNASSTPLEKTLMNSEYSSLGGYFPLTQNAAARHQTTLHYYSDKLVINVREKYLELGMMPIKNQLSLEQ